MQKVLGPFVDTFWSEQIVMKIMKEVGIEIIDRLEMHDRTYEERPASDASPFLALIALKKSEANASWSIGA